MSQPIDPGAPGSPARDDDYEVFLAAVRARFKLVTAEKQGKRSQSPLPGRSRRRP